MSDKVVVPSSPRESFPMTAQSLALALQNHFSSLDGLKTADEAGGPTIVKPVVSTPIGDFNNEHIFVENHVVSKFWADHSEMEENASDTGEDIVCTTRKLGRPLKGADKSKTTTKAVPSKKSP